MVCTHQHFRRIIVMLFEDNVLTKEKKTSQKAKIEALIKASVKIILTFQSGKEI